jgi:catechol-2,3-dioxygenase
MSDSIKIGSVALDCPDARKLAAFYAEIIGGTVAYADEDWAVVKGPGGRLDFQTAPGHQPPAWPDPSSSMQMHLDFDVDDADAAEARVLAAGAT